MPAFHAAFNVWFFSTTASLKFGIFNISVKLKEKVKSAYYIIRGGSVSSTIQWSRHHLKPLFFPLEPVTATKMRLHNLDDVSHDVKMWRGPLKLRPSLEPNILRSIHGLEVSVQKFPVMVSVCFVGKTDITNFSLVELFDQVSQWQVLKHLTHLFILLRKGSVHMEIMLFIFA